jgi:hypothetical protein
VKTDPDDLAFIVDSRCAGQDPPGTFRQQAIEIGDDIALPEHGSGHRLIRGS